MRRLAIVTTHPIQYYAPVFRLLHKRRRIETCVFYTWGEGSMNKHDPGFGKTIAWDIPLLEGYPFQWERNTAPDPGTHHFRGIVTPGLIDDISSYKPDAILFFGWGWEGHLKAIRYFRGKVPVFFRGDSNLLDLSAGLKSGLRYIFLKWVYRCIDHAFYTGANNRAYYKRYGLKDNQLSFVPHAVDNERFQADCSREAQEWRTQLGIGRDEVTILFAGKLEPKKAPMLLLKAFLDLPQSNVHLVFIGDGELEGELRSVAQGAPRVHFAGFQNQSRMPMVYQAADILCLPSKGPGETWGLVVNEAMACGKAVLVSDKVGCAADLVKNGANGFVFPSGDGLQLAERLNNLVSSREQLSKMGKRSAEMIAPWNFTKIAEAIEQGVMQY